MLTREGVDARRGLVEDEQIRVMDQRRAQPDLLLHAARELPGRPVRERIEPGGLQQQADPGAAFRGGEPEEPGEEVDVLEDAELEVEVFSQALRHVRDERANGVAMVDAGDISAQHADTAGLDLLRAGDQSHHGRLANSVGADQSDHAPRGDLGRHGIQSARLAVMVGDVRDGRDRFSWAEHHGTRNQGLGKGFSRKSGHATVSSSRT